MPLNLRHVPGHGFGSIKNVSERCESSLVASAIGLCQGTKETVAAIVSFNGTFEFMTAPESFRSIRGLEWLRGGHALPDGVRSARFAHQHKWTNECDISEEGGKLRRWSDGVADLEIQDAVVGLVRFARRLIVLVTQWDEDDRDPSGEQNWTERWEKGIFRSKKSRGHGGESPPAGDTVFLRRPNATTTTCR